MERVLVARDRAQTPPSSCFLRAPSWDNCRSMISFGLLVDTPWNNKLVLTVAMRTINYNRILIHLQSDFTD